MKKISPTWIFKVQLHKNIQRTVLCIYLTSNALFRALLNRSRTIRWSIIKTSFWKARKDLFQGEDIFKFYASSPSFFFFLETRPWMTKFCPSTLSLAMKPVVFQKGGEKVWSPCKQSEVWFCHIIIGESCTNSLIPKSPEHLIHGVTGVMYEGLCQSTCNKSCYEDHLRN